MWASHCQEFQSFYKPPREGTGCKNPPNPWQWDACKMLKLFKFRTGVLQGIFAKLFNVIIYLVVMWVTLLYGLLFSQRKGMHEAHT